MKRSDTTKGQNVRSADVVPFPDSIENQNRRLISHLRQVFPLDDQAEASLECLNILSSGPLDDGLSGDAA